MKVIHTKDGRTLRKGADGRWFKNAKFKTGGYDYNFEERRSKNGSVDVYANGEFLGNADNSEEIKELKDEYKVQLDQRIKKIKEDLEYAKLALHDPNISDEWTRKSYQDKITRLTNELKELEN